MWNATSKLELPIILKEDNEDILSIIFELNGIILYSASKNKTIKAWNIETHSLIATLYGHKDWVSCLTFNNNETILFSGSWDRQIILWDVETKT